MLLLPSPWGATAVHQNAVLPSTTSVGHYHQHLHHTLAFLGFDSDSQIGVGVPDISQESFRIFTNDGLAVMARDIVPVHTIAVEIVENSQARLRCAALEEFPVVRLRFVDSKTMFFINVALSPKSILGYLDTHPPEWLQSFCILLLTGASFLSSPDQNHPLMAKGLRSSLVSQPLKSHNLPDVQMYFCWAANVTKLVGLSTRTQVFHITHNLWSSSWRTRFRLKFPERPDPCSVVCRSFCRPTSLVLCHW